jgi:hypothetical protein
MRRHSFVAFKIAQFQHAVHHPRRLDDRIVP